MSERSRGADASNGGAARGPAPPSTAEEPVEPPPFLGSWPRLYALVLIELIAVIALCGWLAGLGR
jgi:hypothetical protein